MLNTLGSAAKLIEEGGFSSVRLTADAFHMNIEEADLRKSIVQNKEFIGHVHIADSNVINRARPILISVISFQHFRKSIMAVTWSLNAGLLETTRSRDIENPVAS
jgi:sugar phosphate isomerase/epimerase